MVIRHCGVKPCGLSRLGRGAVGDAAVQRPRAFYRSVGARRGPPARRPALIFVKSAKMTPGRTDFRQRRASAICRESTTGTALSRHYVGEHEAVTLDDLAERAGDRAPEDRPVEDKGVKLAVLPARIDIRWELGEQALVVSAPGES
jgi:hypothetical protein